MKGSRTRTISVRLEEEFIVELGRIAERIGNGASVAGIMRQLIIERIAQEHDTCPPKKTSSGIIHEVYGEKLETPIHYTYSWRAGSDEDHLRARFKAIHNALVDAGIKKPID